MTTTHHADFHLERTFTSPPAAVWAALADPQVKARWFHGPLEWGDNGWTADFRVGGTEHAVTQVPGGPAHTYSARYHDIVEGERAVYTYEMHMDDALSSVSVATWELTPQGTGTLLTLTEQGAFFGSPDDATGREEGTNGLLDAIVAVVDGTDVPA